MIDGDTSDKIPGISGDMRASANEQGTPDLGYSENSDGLSGVPSGLPWGLVKGLGR